MTSLSMSWGCVFGYIGQAATFYHYHTCNYIVRVCMYWVSQRVSLNRHNFVLFLKLAVKSTATLCHMAPVLPCDTTPNSLTVLVVGCALRHITTTLGFGIVNTALTGLVLPVLQKSCIKASSVIATMMIMSWQR